MLIEAAAWKRRRRLPPELRAELLGQAPWLFAENVPGSVREINGRGPGYRSMAETEWMRMTVVATGRRLVVWGLGTKWLDVPPGHPWIRDVEVDEKGTVHVGTELSDSHPGISGRLVVSFRVPEAARVAEWLKHGQPIA